MKQFRECLAKYHGFLTPAMLDALVQNFPYIKVGVRMGCGPRFVAYAKDVTAEVSKRCKADTLEYMRDCFVTAETYDALRLHLGMKNKE